MSFFFPKFNPNKLKPHLKMATQRLQIAANKKSNAIKNQKKEISKLLAEGKEEKARIRAEALIREDNYIEAYEILELQCELLFERMRLIETTKECPGDLLSTVSTLIWASDRIDVAELIECRKQLVLKFGKKLEEEALNNTNGVLNDRVVLKLSVQPPSSFLVLSYLREIAAQYNIDYEPTDDTQASDAAMAGPTGFSVPVAPGSDFAQVYQQPPGQVPALPEGWAYTNDGLLAKQGQGQGQPQETPMAQPFVQPLQPQYPPQQFVNPQQFVATNQAEFTAAQAAAALNPEKQDYDIVVPPAGENKPAATEEAKSDSKNDDAPGYDDLAARFNALKR
jgi:vacuolar protein sorting-associated protein IST1